MADLITPIIGKYVLENLTTGMYNDPFCVYREYIQNAADAIDKALSTNLINSSNAKIYIQIHKESRQITFEDNGTGIAHYKVVDVLRNIAQSDKVIGKDKGFRGIGRLGGLGYCEELLFETSCAGEEVKSVLKWDAKLLKRMVHDRTTKESAIDVIATVTSFFDTEKEELNKHYFKVTLSGVSNPDLLDFAAVKDYLQMVAPLPFAGGFIFRTKIKEDAALHGVTLDEYTVFLNQDKLYKEYTTQLYKEVNGKRSSIGEIKDVFFFNQKDKAGNLLYWGWRSVSNIQNIRLTSVNKARGLRLRKGNIQIGDEYVLSKCFRDTRFNHYVIGEVHALSPALVPNGRRDDFEDSDLYTDFKTKLKSICDIIQKLAVDASKITSAQKKIEEVEKTKDEIKTTLEKGITNKQEIDLLNSKLTQKQNEAEVAVRDLQKIEKTIATSGDEALTRIYQHIVKPTEENKSKHISPEIVYINNENKPIFRSDKLSKLTKAERKLVGEIFDVITKVLSKDLAENLIQKLEENFK